MKMKSITFGILLSFNVAADGFSFSPTSQDQPWSVTASFGNGQYQKMNPEDSQSALGRLAVGNELMLTGDYALGLELGLQSGHDMVLHIPNETLALLGWLPVQTSLGPMLDLLITAKSDPLGKSAVYAQLKGGVAYRRWKLSQKSLNNLSQLAAEIQAGFGYPVTALASLNLLYQGIYGNDPTFRIDASTQNTHVANIPVLHAVLLGLSVNL